MATRPFPLEKIFGSRTRVKIITLFTTGVKRPYYVREIARNVNERLNAVRRELEILEKVGMLASHEDRRRKYYVLNPEFILVNELASIMTKTGPGVEDTMFKNIERVGRIRYACVSGYFTGAKDAPTDLLLIGDIREDLLSIFIERIEEQLGREITYTPMAENEYQYRLNVSDMFLRSIFRHPYKELVNKLEADIQPETMLRQTSRSITRTA